MTTPTFDVEVTYSYRDWELPSPRHRKHRPVDKTATITVHVPVLTAEQAPLVARIPHTSRSTDSQDQTVHEEIRAWNGHLWTPYLDGDRDQPPVHAGSPDFPAQIDRTGWHNGRDQADAEDSTASRIREQVIIDGIVHRRREEPVYYVRTYNFMGNHGGTALFVGTRSTDPDDALATRTWPVTARDAAVAGAVRVALERGDTDAAAALPRTAPTVEVFDPSHFTQPTAEETVERKRAEVKKLARKARATIKVDDLTPDSLEAAINLLQEARDAIWRHDLYR